MPRARDRVLTAAEAAEYLRVSRKTLYRLAAAGEVTGRKVGRAWRFYESELVRYLTGKRGPAGPRHGG
ncbi:MAG: helix-turn-helix domain-containing protein [Armatimonadota bacterium]|nr:helix-turn-helix domain-containing protein [Armatimonadota bacterium]MDR7567908.1 helix-turn-helix domain-containing protein [Armatimonadota bacterium]